MIVSPLSGQIKGKPFYPASCAQEYDEFGLKVGPSRQKELKALRVFRAGRAEELDYYELGIECFGNFTFRQRIFTKKYKD